MHKKELFVPNMWIDFTKSCLKYLSKFTLTMHFYSLTDHLEKFS